MKDETQLLLDRTFWFGVSVLKFLGGIPRRFVYSVPRYQLAKSATSIGSNYEEAQAAESRPDFVHKIGIVLKECRESQYWLRVLQAIYREPIGHDTLNRFVSEANELKNIFAQIRITTQKRKGK